MLIVLAGLPEPEVNVAVRDGEGRLLFRFDLCYPELQLIVEYDGRQHAEDADQWLSDIDRREWIDDERWRILIVTSKGLFREPERTLRRIQSALRKQGHRDARGPLSDAWRPHFTAR